MKEKKGVTQDVELDADDLKTLANQFKAEYKEKIGADFPADPKEQTSRGFSRSPNFLPVIFSSLSIYSIIWA